MAIAQDGFAEGKIDCNLYSYNYSLCSLMTRYMFAVRGQAEAGGTDFNINDVEVDIHHAFDQLDEWYLCDVNSKGQVPAFRLETKPPKIITDSLEIAELFVGLYPALRAPAGQEAKHDALLRELHALDYFAICFTAAGAPVSANPRIQAQEKTQERLSDGSISPRYRDALNHKLQVLGGQLDDATGAGHVATAMEEARAFFNHIEEVTGLDSPWIWGHHGPTALDTHAITFLARLKDVNHEQFFTEKLTTYFNTAANTEAWKNMIQGRSTMG